MIINMTLQNNLYQICHLFCDLAAPTIIVGSLAGAHKKSEWRQEPLDMAKPK